MNKARKLSTYTLKFPEQANELTDLRFYGLFFCVHPCDKHGYADVVAYTNDKNYDFFYPRLGVG
jgi:hypothetical protein